MGEHPSVTLAVERLTAEYWEKSAVQSPPRELTIESGDLKVYSLWLDIEGTIYEADLWEADEFITYRLKENSL